MQKKVSGWYLFVLNAYWIGLSFMWNSLHVTILPAVLLNYVPSTQKNTWLGLLTFFGLILAMIIQPLSGALSDKWSSKIGRRRPFIWLGTLGDLVFLGILAFVGGLPAIFIGYLGLQVMSNIAHGPTQGLLPDEVPAEQLGMASGIKIALDMFGIIVSSLLMGSLITSTHADPKKSVLAIIGFMVVFGAITLLGSHEKSAAAVKPEPIKWKELWKDVFNLKTGGSDNKSYWTLILSRFLYLVGIYGFQSFAQYFIRDKFPEQDAVSFVQFVMGSFVIVLIIFTLLAGSSGDKNNSQSTKKASIIFGIIGILLVVLFRNPATLLQIGPSSILLQGGFEIQLLIGGCSITLIVLTLLLGFISKKYGRKGLQILAGFIGAVGAILLIFANTPAQLIGFGSVMGVGLGIFMSTNWAMANQMSSGTEAGKLMGLTNLATAGSAAVARLEGPMIDWFNNMKPGSLLGWTVLFALSAVLMIASSLAMRKVPETAGEHAK